MPKQPQDHKTPTYGFGKKQKYVDLELPSGNVVQVKRADPQSLIRAGLLDDLDSLTGAVATETIPRAEGKIDDAQKKALDTKQVLKSLEAMDKIVQFMVVTPPVTLNEDEASEEVAWVGDIDLGDKTAIVSHASGGNSDLATFRQAAPKPVDGVPPGA